MAFPVVLVASGGIAVSEAPTNYGLPATPVTSNGIAVTLVPNGGLSVTFISADGVLWPGGVEPGGGGETLPHFPVIF